MNTILIVDDEPKIRNMYGKFFSNEDYKTYESATVGEALDVLAKNDIDLVLLDINMKKISGDVLNDIMQMFHKGVKVIVSSVYPVDEQKIRIKGADDYCDKSQGIQVLHEKVKAIIGSSVRKKRIIIVDDEPRIRDIYHKLLLDEGYSSIEFDNASEALEYSRKNPNSIDLIVLDIDMPGVGGVDFFEVIKNNHPQIKVLIASVYPIEEQQSVIFDADDYYDKADTNSMLLKKVKKLLYNN